MIRRDVVVIGAGVNGLAAAVVLARHGRRVLVVEQREAVGGTAVTEEFHPGFRANLCRDDVGWVAPFVRAELRGAGALEPLPAPVGLVIASDDGPAIVTMPDAAATANALRRIAPEDASHWEGFSALVSNVAAVLESAYGTKAPVVPDSGASDVFALAGLGRRLRRLGRRQMLEVLRAVPMPVADLLDEWFMHPALKGGLATVGIRDVLHGPLSSGTGLVFFHHHVGSPLGHVGVRRVMPGGTGALVTLLQAAAQRAGAEIRTGAAVQEVSVHGGRVTGVVLASGEELLAPTVVSALDPRRTFALVAPEWLDPLFLEDVDHVRMRGATARVHLALDALPTFTSYGQAWTPETLSGTIILAPDILGVERAYDAAKFGRLPERPSMIVVVPSVLDPTLAPTNKHVVSVSVHHVPWALRDGWTAARREEVGELVLRRLEEVAPGIRDRVLHRLVLTPADLAERFGVTEGSLTHGEIALDQMLFMRPVPACARYATPLPGLWLCGMGTHPANAAGASGVLAAREVLVES
ncbi:MAG TPA: NAD(P)/FAD-dependent oxidoreductase [Gemmatimonadaceae bacterium]